MLNFGLKGTQQLTILKRIRMIKILFLFNICTFLKSHLAEHWEIEVIVVVCNGHLASSIDSHTNGVVGDACTWKEKEKECKFKNE